MARLSDDPQGGRCVDGLLLRRKLEKLRWLGLDNEADRLADEIAHLACRLPQIVPGVALSTD